MNLFLTSDPSLPAQNALNSSNGFTSLLRSHLPEKSNILFVCSDPDAPRITDHFADEFKTFAENSGIAVSSFTVLDRRNAQNAKELAAASDFVILAGGHVPTQNTFFGEISLADLLKDFDGTVLGISAGTMNCAQTVYALPELDGEASDPAYRRFRPGLGLTDISVIPHYGMLKDEKLDGLCVMEDMAYPDSTGRQFILLTDGSFVFSDGTVTKVYGESYALSDGILEKLCSDGEEKILS